VQHCCEIEIEISFEISCDIVFEISFEASSFLASVLPSTLSAVNLFKLFLPAEKNAMLRDFVGGSIEKSKILSWILSWFLKASVLLGTALLPERSVYKV
jgi:hypothetical protein